MKLERMQNDPALFELLVIGCAVEEELEEAEAQGICAGHDPAHQGLPGR